jgi:hypothetical protein
VLQKQREVQTLQQRIKGAMGVSSNLTGEESAQGQDKLVDYLGVPKDFFNTYNNRITRNKTVIN